MSLKETPLGTPEQFNVVIEIPKGSPSKLEYDFEKDQMTSHFDFEHGFTFICNYGFIPQTKSADGDTLDVIVLGDNPIPSGTVVSCRPIGIIKQIDKGQQDDKILAVVIGDAPTYHYKDIVDFTEAERQKFIAFYAEIGRQRRKVVQIIGFEDKASAIETIKKAAL